MPLKFTKNQNLILNIFFEHPCESFYLRQLARIIGKEPGVFQRDINKLVESGLLESEFKGNVRFFSLNAKYPLYGELRSIFLKTSGVAGQLKEKLGAMEGIKKAFIFGSFARGEEKRDSDIDLFIVGSVAEDAFLDVISKLEGDLGRAINYSLIGEREYQRKIENRNSFLLNILKQKKIDLIC